ncbi:MAG: type II restriction endonuclease [Chloroflexi bacterium]|nr:type II restriction endonuclease [Chloroflexota bacterium]
MPDLAEWLPFALSPPRRAVYKRLSANDTGATGAHQVGPYIPNRVAFALDPTLEDPVRNPRRDFHLRLISHAETSTPSLIYYNNRRFGGTRNECRLTGFGGRQSALFDPESTGALLILSFGELGSEVEGWLATDPEEDQVIEAVLGPVEPGIVGFIGPDPAGTLALFEVAPGLDSCRPDEATLPSRWRQEFPSASEISAHAAALVPPSLPMDTRFLRRHDCEYSLFQVVEEHHLLPVIGGGFRFVADFLALAQTTLQRRKSRAGKSLELQLARIFDEERLEYVAQAQTELGHRPDFLFPSLEAYRQLPSGHPSLAMLAVKSTLRDRWRQVLTEADKIPVKHLFTLDQGLSDAQFRDVTAAGIRLVVPERRLASYPASLRVEISTLAAFVQKRARRRMDATRLADGP